MLTSKNDNEISEEKEDFQIKIKKYPSSSSAHLIDYFLVIGYEELFIQNNIVKNIQNQDFANNNINKYKCEEYPTILSSINSDNKGEMLDDEDIVKYIFPEQPYILYNKGYNLGIDIKEKNIIFSKVEKGINNIGYSYTFYEFITMPNRTKIYIPKTFVIISQYPYFITFNQICKEIYNLFHSNNIQIPIELQLYNIINYIPIPLGKRLDISLFPFYDLNTINKCLCNEEFISLENQKIYSLIQIKGYNKPQINICEIFELIPVEVIVEIYLKILSGHVISIFNNDIELLNIILILYKYFLFPLSTNNNAYCYSQNQYFNETKKIYNNKEYIYGFNTDYNNINKENSNSEIDKDNIFALNYYLDMSKKSLGIQVPNGLDEKSKKLNEYIKKIINESSNENNDSNINMNTLEGNIKKLVLTLNNIKDKIKKYGNKISINFFEYNSEKELETNNQLIIEAFYHFNIYISSHYFKFYFNESNENDNNNENNDDTEEDKIFYSLFSKSEYSKKINDLKSDYLLDENEQDNIIKIFFENILLNKKNNLFDDKFDNLNFIDLFFKGKEDKSEAVTFLDFYKYYNNKLQSYFYEVINNEFVDCIINKKEEKVIKYLYKYKQINLDKNILLKYNYLIEQMPQEDKKKCFPYFDNLLLSSFDNFIRIKDIYEYFENFFINNKIVNTIDIIIMSILDIVALSISGHKLIYFTDSIFELIKQNKVSTSKFILSILSISYRIFTKEKNQNLFIYKKYFNLFDYIIENKIVFINNDLNVLHKKIEEFMDSIKDKKNEEVEASDYKSIKDADIKKIFTLEPKLKEKDALNIVSNATFNGILKNNKITFKTKFIKDKNIVINEVSSPIKVYKELSKMLDEYNQNLDFTKINKDDYKKLIVHLIYYCNNLYPQDFQKGIIKFLVYCLKIDH